MTALANHPGFWLRADAAQQLALLERDHGIIPINSAGRSVAEQEELIRRWNKGGKWNRPPYLYEPKRPARASAHVKGGGIAFDTTATSHVLEHGEPYGFYQPYSWDLPHFEFDPARVKIRPVKIPPLPKGKTMSDVRMIHWNTPEGKVGGRALIVPGTPWVFPWTEPETAVYANRMTKQFETGTSQEYTRSIFDAMIAASARCAPTAFQVTAIPSAEG